MVDFQSRDTTRGLSSDDDDDVDEEASDSQAGDSEGDETAVEQAGTDSEATESRSADGAPTESDPVDGNATESDPVDGNATESDQTESGDSDHDDGHEHDHDDQSHGHDGHDHSHSNGHGHHDHSHEDHHHADVEQLGVAVVTVSSSRSLDDDPSGDAAQALVEGDGHSVVARDLVADDLDGVQRAVLALTDREDVDVVVTTGGTGVTPDDVTIEAVSPLFDKKLPGFGELFRILSYEEVGTRAMGSRATAGVSEGVPVFCLPGSEDAVRTAVEELILAEAPHLVGLANGD